MTKICLIELNEVSFDIVSRYIDAGHELNNFSWIINQGVIHTSSESKYELLEPWIQWASIHTGKTFNEHQIYRLGDIEKHKHRQIFEEIESRGYKVGSLSAMNAKNELNDPSFFIPDPWTNTQPDKSLASKLLSDGISASVNSNTSKSLKKSSLLKVLLGALLIISPKQYKRLYSKLTWALKKPWRKAIFLDIIIMETYRALLDHKRPEFSCVFLNSAAHLQHHYFLSSPLIQDGKIENPQWYIEAGSDPLLDAYKQYDEFLGFLINDPNYSYILATGLSQTPVEAPVFYYRLKSHENFLNDLKIDFTRVDPRMTRDFLIRFNSNQDREYAFKILNSLELNGNRLFGEIEIRDLELFVTLTYPHEITKDSFVYSVLDNSINLKIESYVNFVAIKNGKHSGTGYLAVHPEIKTSRFKNGMHVAELFDGICELYPPKKLV